MDIRRTLLISVAAAAVGTLPAVASPRNGEAPQSTDASAVSNDPAQNGPTSPVASSSEDTGEIVVTAQKREQTLIDVPQSISVVSSKTLENRSVNNITDYLNAVPSLQLVQATPGQGRLVIRGVNTGGVASTVSVYLDETPFGSSSGLANGAELAGDFDPFDLARIEVLRGPQGTLYGASSLGGVVKYITNAPDPTKLEARVRAGVEGTDGGAISYQGNAVINLPLADNLAFRASGSYRKQGGFIDSIGTAGSDRQKNINDYKTYGGRASLLWTPTPELRVRASALLQNIDVDAPTRVESDSATLQPLYGALSYSQYVPSYSDVNYRLYNLLLNYDFGFATLTYSTSYSTQRQRRHDDQTVFTNNLLAKFDLPPVGGDTYVRQLTNNRKWTQEVRLASNKGDLFEWIVGGYYTHEKALIDQLFVPVASGTLDPLSYLPQVGGLGAAIQPSVYREYAGFANGTLHLGRRFDLDFGGRYSHNSQNTLIMGSGLLGAGGTAGRSTSSDNVFTYSVAPKVEFGDHASLYARVAKGYRPGGPNTLSPQAPAGTPTTYKADSTVNYEVGVKAETADRTFGIEASGYHIDWKRIQLIAVVGGFGINVNGTSADVDGAEVTATLRPTGGLIFTVNAAYNNAKLAGDTDPMLLGAIKGDRLPFSPKYTISVNGDYEWDLTSALKASVGGSIRSLSNQSGRYDPAYLSTFGHFARVPAYEQVDLRASLEFGRYELQAYVKNVNNARGITDVLPAVSNTVFNYPGGASATGIIRPRTVGLSLTAGF